VVEVVTRADPSRDVVVRTFVPAAADGSDASTVTEALARLRRTRRLQRRVWVTIWGLRSTQQLLKLPPARTEDLEALAIREARKDIAQLETGGDGATVAAMPGAEVQVGPQRRREVSLVAVSNADVRDHLQPVVDAGFVVEGVGTPALALAALARSRQGGTPGATAAYVAIGSRASCLAVIRDGVLLFAREMAWGHAGVAGEAIDARLAAELKRSILYFKQTFRAAVESVVLCGDMPNLRTLTQPLGDALGVAVEALDSLVGVDAAALPEPADAFRGHVAALRVAIAAGADPVPTPNLLPAGIREARRRREETVRFAAAVVAGVLVAAAWLFLIESAARKVRLEASALERQVARLDLAAAGVRDQREARAVAAARQAALQAFDTQGPRLARFLEAVAQSAPEPLVVTSIALAAAGPQWQIDVTGTAMAEDAAASHGTVRTFLARMSESPFAGPPAQAPALRVRPGTGGGADDPSAGAGGVEFTARFVVGK
jgi:Tfp pilus assembly protein PilN